MSRISANELRQKLADLTDCVVLDELGNEISFKGEIQNLGRAGKAVLRTGEEVYWLKTNEVYEVLEVKREVRSSGVSGEASRDP